MEDNDTKMGRLKEQGATVRGYKGQVTKVMKRIEKAKEQLDGASFQEVQASNENFKSQLENFNKTLDKLESCVADMSVTVELGISLANNLPKEDFRERYLEDLEKYSRYISKSAKETEDTSDHVERMQKHAIEALAHKEEEKAMEEKFRANESFKKSVQQESGEGFRTRRK